MNRFDEILALVIDKYSLGVGPQTRPFGRHVLSDRYVLGAGLSHEDVDAKLNALGYGPEGDRELVETILGFSRFLFEKCGNRSLYSSSERLGDLLHTTSLSLLQSTLRLSLCLAQRYHARHRGGSHIQPSLLATHYNMDLEKLQKVAAPFPRPLVPGKTSTSDSSAAPAKGKEKAVSTKHNANDLITLMRENDGWHEWGHVRLLYYPSGAPEKPAKTMESRLGGHSSETPSTPTPVRRSNTQPTPRLSRTSTADGSPGTAGNTPSGKQDEASRGGKTLDIPYAKVFSTKAEDLLASYLAEVPNDSKYELLHRVRTAQGLATSHPSREQVLSVRALAIANLAYIYPESMFQQKILQYDIEQPKRLQLAYQLAELVHLGASGDIQISRTVQALVVHALDGLSKIKSRSMDVCAALSINVNHGVLMFLTRKMVNELGSVDNDNDDASEDEWRDALLSLLRSLPSSSTRTPETLVAAGLIPMFVDILNLRTKKARRVYSRVIEFLDIFVHTVRDALGTLTTAKGFDAISDLIEFETKSSYENVQQGAGIPDQYKTPSIDYQIPYFQQQTLRWLFRFANHIMSHNSGGFDRVLRNMIDSPQLLTSLRLVFENARIFGSNVWSNAVNILSSFIHNEPTSYAVIAEAGLSKSFLEAVMLSEVKAPEKPAEPEIAEGQAEGEQEGAPAPQPAAPDSTQPAETTQEPREYVLARPNDAQLALGIMPSAEALSCIPSGFGAICLNGSGLKLFQSSHALDSFFEIFESPDHVKCMKDDPNLVRGLGSTFDELARHHPALKSSIMTAVIVMTARVGLLCRSKAWKQGMGTKLWTEGPQQEPVVSGDLQSLFREISAQPKTPDDYGVPELNSTALPNGGKLVVGDLSPLVPSADESLQPKDVDESGLSAADYLYPVVRFLGAFFENQPNCSYFIESGGVEFALDFASLQSLNFDFHNTETNRELTELVHMMAETKPHLVIPSLVNRAQIAVDSLSNFWAKPNDFGFFSSMVKPVNEKAPEGTSANAYGTHFAKHMGAALVLTDLLREVYSLPPVYQTRPSQQTSAFLQVILADKYCSLVTALGRLHGACVWEEIVLEKNIPDTWDQATKVHPPGAGTERNDALGLSAGENAPMRASEPNPGGVSTDEPSQTQPIQGRRDSKSQVSEDNLAFKNVQTLRYLLSSLPSSIASFFHNLGLGLIGKRRMDHYQRQNATMVADHIAKTVIDQLQFGPPNSSDSPRMKLAYLIVVLSSFSHLLFEASADRPNSQYLTLVLFAFKRNNGLKVMKDICDVFVKEINALTPPESVHEAEKDVSARLTSAYGGIKIVLAFFAELASGKNIVDSSQTQAMTSSERDRDRPDFFQPGQFLVDLRMEILPITKDLWNSEFAVKSSSSVVKYLVDILRSSLDGEYETGAARHSDPASKITEVPRRTLVINKERIASLQEKGYDKELTKEALYRCNNVYIAAEEYCKAQTWLRTPPRIPPPVNDLEAARGPAASGGEASEDTTLGDAPPFNGGFLERSALAMLLAQASGRDEGAPQDQDPARAAESGAGNGPDFLARALNHILNDEHDAGGDGREGPSNPNPNHPEGTSSESPNGPANQPADQPSEQSSGQPTRRREIATIDDLNGEREKVRSNLIERCLDVLNEHHDVSFELSDLIASATRKHREPESFRREVGEILVQSLVSLQMEDFQVAGKKIAAYAHLLALVLQDRDMYNATLEELKECFGTFLAFVKIPTPEKTADESFPWIGHVLLILEKLLSDDAQPPQIHWTPPPFDNPHASSETPARLGEPLVPHDQKLQLFEALVEILPRVGKDDTLALSICRVLVILTRRREIASRLGEKRSLQRLFVMVKQLSSTSNEKLQSAFMLILRHIVEDEDTIRQIMRSEIVSSFESKPSRQIDTTGYVRQMYHLVLRAPELFVEVTNENLKLQRYESHQRPQSLALKSSTPGGASSIHPGLENARKNGENASGEAAPSEDKDKDKGKGTELKMPVVENPDGVIHYLLSELLSYKDVDDKEPNVESSEPTGPEQSGNHTDVEMTTDEPAPSFASTDMQAGRTSKKTDKQQGFKSDDHPIYIYRCFLLQCLTELLSSYNRTKIEFINFSRKADPQAATPQKPRSGILNYLLNVLVPVGTMDHDESIPFKKRSNTSAWTMRVVVALCTKTGEFGGTGRRRFEQSLNEEDEPELAFVRRFVLEHALRSYKDANASNESLDAKYSRLMSLADLFDKMLSDHTLVSGDAPSLPSRRQLEKTMFEKHFVSALSASLAEIDLNFPSSRRVIKYILRPLNKLTRAAVTLSQTSDISSLGETEEDEISSATSVSEMENEREETPDLFRHSTLGMLEPRHQGETDSEESVSEGDDDDEMYDDEYDDETDYDEEMPEDDGEVVSDDDEEAMGPIEGLPGDSGMDIEVVIDDDERDDEDEDEDEDEDPETEDDEIYAGEITGDRDNESLEEGDDDEWESEDMPEDDHEAEMMNQFEDELDDIRHTDQRGDGQRLDDLFRVINQAAGGVEGLHADDLGGDLQDDMVDDDLNDEEDEEIDELEEELDDIDDQASYEFDDDDPMDPWWDGEDLPPSRVPHHHRFRGPPPAWTAVTGIMPGRPGMVPIQPYRMNRTHVPARGTDDGTNPLLLRSDQPPEAAGQPRGPGNEPLMDWVHGMGPISEGRMLPVDSPVSFMNAIMQAIGGAGQGTPGFGVVNRPDGIHVHVDRAMPPSQLQDIFGLGRPQPAPVRARDDPSQAVSFALASTKSRWQEEARTLFSSTYVEKTQRIVNSLLKHLVPPAIEEEKRRQKQAEEDRKRREEERVERERQERIAREEEEKERKRKEDEENAKREQEREQREAEQEAAGEISEPMDGVQQTDTARAAEPSAQVEGGPAEPVPRVHTTIRGRQVDITGMEIDPEYLEALPEELREEVIMQQLAEQRSQAAAAGEEPSEINTEFLEALPPEIREELLQQEAADRRRRERESARRQAATPGGPAHAEDMDAQSFLATLEPALRQAVLAEQPEDILANLGPEYLSEARALSGRHLAQFGDIGGADHRQRHEQPEMQEPKRPQRRQIVQMLDKPGVATLVRLMFMPLQGNARHQLNDILQNICENRQNRIEVISLLLSVLQDGSADVSAVERSFAQLSLRAKAPSAQKTPQSVKRSMAFQSSSNVSSEVTPIMVVQQCLGTLSFLSQYNPHIAWFFLSEHDPSSTLKLKAFRKGKAKENRANKFALNALLSLLDRSVIMENTSCMEQLSTLLSSITQPLTLLVRREKEKQEEEKGKQADRAQGQESLEEREQLVEQQPEAAEGDSGADATMADAPRPTVENTESQAADTSAQAEEGAADSKEAGAEKKREDQKPKKRTLEPPVVPEYHLRLVVRILSARECNGKTFRDTLSTINNVSIIPGARDIIGNELVHQAQGLSTTILADLSELLPYIHQAKTGTDMQGLALSKFSPASSDQAKLLRILTALDYLFDPSRMDKVKGLELDSAAKEDTLKALYESATFGPLWTRLSECLTVIRQKENMLNVATILLPLIEALMVVCKNTALKDAPLPRNSRELSVSSASPETSFGMENLFFKFTEEHRKILNELVRQNPKLMSGTFSLLVKNPKVLEFDNKRNYFTRRLHSRGAEARHPHPPLQLSVRRDQVFLDSFKSLYFKTAEELKYGKLNVRFHGEEGVDAGGVTREWFQVLARGMFNPNYALFIPVAADRTTFHPNRLSGVNSEHLMFFKFIGRIIGKALYEGRVLDCHFSRAVYKCILGRNVSIKDMETLDLDYYKSLLWMLENDITDIITETFSVETDDFGEKQVIDLKEDGRNIPVTQENKEEYIQRVVDYRLVRSVKEQLDNFLKGMFWDHYEKYMGVDVSPPQVSMKSFRLN